MDPRDPTPVSITEAGTSRSDDVRRRQINYIGSMLLRTLCFVGAVVADGWLRWTLVAGAIFLPYVAVVLANAATRRRPGTMSEYVETPYGQLNPGHRGKSL